MSKVPGVIVEKRLQKQRAETDVIAGPQQPWCGAGTLVAVLFGCIGTLGEVED